MRRALFLLSALGLLAACDTGSSDAPLAAADDPVVEMQADLLAAQTRMTAVPLSAKTSTSTPMDVDLEGHQGANFYFDSQLRSGSLNDPLNRVEQWRVDIHSQAHTSSGTLETVSTMRYQPRAAGAGFEMHTAWPGVDADAAQVCWWSGDVASLVLLGCERILAPLHADGSRDVDGFVLVSNADEEGTSYHRLPSGRIVLDYEGENGGARIQTPSGRFHMEVTFISVRFLNTTSVGDPPAPAHQIRFEWHPTVDLWLTNQDLY